MRPIVLPLLLACGAACAAERNPAIDYEAFTRDVAAVRELREARRIPEAEFVRMAREPGTIVLDARSERLFRLRHVKGAVNVSFPEFTADTLAGVIPSPTSRVLIYCNNNFRGAPESMPMKAVSSALNVSTFVSLHAYGYRYVYELAPAVDVRRTLLEFEGDEVRF